MAYTFGESGPECKNISNLTRIQKKTTNNDESDDDNKPLCALASDMPADHGETMSDVIAALDTWLVVVGAGCPPGGRG